MVENGALVVGEWRKRREGIVVGDVFAAVVVVGNVGLTIGRPSEGRKKPRRNAVAILGLFCWRDRSAPQSSSSGPSLEMSFRKLLPTFWRVTLVAA